MAENIKVKYNKLDKQTKQINVVINYPVMPSKELVDHHNKMISNLLSTEFGAQYAYCVHWFDTQDSGELKHIHTHIVIELPKRMRLKTLLTIISDYANINVDYITIEHTRSLNASIQYLIHKNDPNKYQYAVSSIVSNYSINDLDYLLNNNDTILNIDTLKQIIIDSDGALLYIIEMIGVARYNMYRKTIIDLYMCCYNKPPYTMR